MKRLVDDSKASFDAVLEALIENGNSVVGDGWYVDKEGHHLLLAQPIDWPLLYSMFTFSTDAIKLDDDSIATWNPAYEIRGRRTQI
ncbi:hypothetical protein ABT364_27030 [Massilia sp. SR12]